MMSEEIISSHWKSIWLVLGGWSFVAVAVWLLGEGSGDNVWIYAALFFFGFCGIVGIYELINPPKLRLDDKGFTLSGGFMRGERQTKWSDVEPFAVINVAQGGKIIVYNLKPHARNETLVMKLVRAIAGADCGLPMGWPGKPEELADRLNAYRMRTSK